MRLLEYEETIEIEGTAYVGRLILYNLKGGECFVVDLPEDDLLWGNELAMQPKIAQIPFISKSSTGRAY